MNTINQKELGLFNKFNVARTDGKDAPGEKHEGDEYFVLNLTTDKHSTPALAAYSDACAADYPVLAADLRAKIPTITLPGIGSPMPGGFFSGVINLNGQRFALILASKKLGELSGAWHKDEADVPGAMSYNDGLANTVAMAMASSDLAKQVRGLTIDSLSDFYIPSQDELELCYRAFKPTTERNWCYARSGINLSAMPPTYPYTPTFPIQTTLDLFKQGGEEAFEPQWYWSSTQHALYSDSAWYQSFYYGSQYNDDKSSELRVRAVRRQPI